MKHHDCKASQLAKSETVKQMPLICSNELAAVEFLEKTRWGDCPCCVHCGSIAVFKLLDKATGERNKRFLWKCKDCKKQFTVRIGTVYEESRIALRHWCLAFWVMSVSKKGISRLRSFNFIVCPAHFRANPCISVHERSTAMFSRDSTELVESRLNSK